MFDSSKVFNIPNLDGSKRCQVRFPSDVEWCDRARRLKTIRRDLGRDKARYETPNARRVDGELFAHIRVDVDGPEFTEAEAAKVIDRLDSAKVIDVRRVGSEYTVALKVPGGETVHRLRIPSQEQVDRFSDESGSTTYGTRATEIRVYLDPAGPLYDAVVLGNEGYAGTVPITHKLAALRAMLADVEALLEDEDPEE